MDKRSETATCVVGGVDAHKDLHVAAVVDERDHVLGTHAFPTTRQGYRQMLHWMQSFGELTRASAWSVPGRTAQGCSVICTQRASTCSK